MNRRTLLKSSALLALCGGAGLKTSLSRAQTSDQKYLFVIAASGGANILDSFLPIADSNFAIESGVVRHNANNVLQPTLNAGGTSALRCVEYGSIPALNYKGGTVQRQFLERHGQDVALMTQTGTSVNHIVAAKRSLNGAGNINRGRTLMEAMAMQYASDQMVLPNCNMTQGGYNENGDDPSIPSFARAETIANPLLFPLATHSTKGVFQAARAAPLEAETPENFFQRCRRLRAELDEESVFHQTFRNTKATTEFLERRESVVPLMEDAELIKNLLLVDDTAGDFNLGDYGLSPNETFLSDVYGNSNGIFTMDDMMRDAFMSQAALAYLLARSGSSVAVAISPKASVNLVPEGELNPGAQYEFINTPLAFDFSHTNHFTTQNVMWDRILGMTDALISLLKSTPLASGTMWDKSLIYIATEFGRSKQTGPLSAQGIYGTGHELNNGTILVSPMLNGNQIYGGVLDLDAPAERQGLTYGFDDNGESGGSIKDEDVYSGANIKREEHVYATICKTLGVEGDSQSEIDALAQDCMIKA